MKARALSFERFLTEVLRLTLSRPWSVLVRVAIDRIEPHQLDAEDREIARRLFGDVDVIPEDARRVMVWRLGRASGKTTIAAALILWALWTSDLSRVGGN